MACGDQRGVIFQAGELLPGLQQAPTEVALASAPIQPVCGCLRKLQRGAEGFDLLPLAARYINIQAMAGGRNGLGRLLMDSAELASLRGKLWERRGRRQVMRGVVAGFGVIQRALAQPVCKLGMLGFPSELKMSKGPWFPQPLVLDQKRIQRLEACSNVPGMHRHAASVPAI